MKCPHCDTYIHPEFDSTWRPVEYRTKEEFGFKIYYSLCPACDSALVELEEGDLVVKQGYDGEWIKDIGSALNRALIYPVLSKRSVDPSVPDQLASDFKEACMVMNLSPKASAALSRRILQQILQEKFGIKKRNLASEIEEFVSLESIPAYLAEAVDAIRQVGNFAAHAAKNVHSGEIVDVEPGEAEWLLDVIDSLFDFTYIQPQRLSAMKDRLNTKLASIGKPKVK